MASRARYLVCATSADEMIELPDHRARFCRACAAHVGQVIRTMCVIDRGERCPPGTVFAMSVRDP